MSPEERFWNRVWAVLVVKAGAHPDDGYHFVQQQSRELIEEWRFQGALGFGGKLRRDRYGEMPLRVDCYREHETPERLRMIEETNAALAVLAQWHSPAADPDRPQGVDHQKERPSGE